LIRARGAMTMDFINRHSTVGRRIIGAVQGPVAVR
jgi:hypothetical protein